MREVDLITGPFADRHIDALTDAELDQYEQLLEVREQELLAWVMGQAPVPAEQDTPLFRRVRDFHLNGGR